MKNYVKRMILWTPAILAIAAFIWIYVPDVAYYRHLKKQQVAFDQFHATLEPILRSEHRFDFVFCQRFTGGERGSLMGSVYSTNDLESLRQIFLTTQSNHPASVSFNVEFKELK